MRTALALALLASPAAAWEFSATPLCTLTGGSAEAEVVLTYDPALPEYTISITLPGAWPLAPVFGMAFDGPRPLTIQTPRHVLSEDRRTLTVTDTGFGNVLNGMEFNDTALALTGSTMVPIPLAGIGPAMQAFRACPEAALS